MSVLSKARSKVRVAAVAALVGASLTAAVPLAAPAAASTSQCPSYRFCIWQFPDATGLFAYFSEGTSNLGVAFDGQLNDKTSYIWNRDDEPWCVYQHKDEGGHSMMVPNGKRGSIANIIDPRDGFTWDNRISSLRPALHIVPPRNPGAAYYICIGDYIVWR